MIEHVREFNEKFSLPLGESDILTTHTEVQQYRVKLLQEELDELKLALEHGNKVDMFDALLDLVYVAQGTALFAGIDCEQWNAGMLEVHRANMAKERVVRLSDSKRASAFDVVKPEGWVGPESRLEEILSW